MDKQALLALKASCAFKDTREAHFHCNGCGGCPGDMDGRPPDWWSLYATRQDAPGDGSPCYWLCVQCMKWFWELVHEDDPEFQRHADDGMKFDDQLMLMIERSFSREQDKRQEPRLDALVKRDPRNAALWSDRAAAKAASGDFEAALADMDRAIELSPDNASHYCERSKLLNTLDQGERAFADANRAIEIDPRLAEAYVLRAELRHVSNASSESVDADYAKALELEPAFPKILNQRAQYLRAAGFWRQKRGENEAAMTWFWRSHDICVRVIKMDTRNVEARVGLAMVLVPLDLQEQAVQILRQALAIEPSNQRALELQRALAEDSSGSEA